MLEYGAAVPKPPESSVMITQKGFQQVGNSLRYDIDNYQDLIC